MRFNQALELGDAVRKGEPCAAMVFASRFSTSELGGDGGDIEHEMPFLTFAVFNVAQLDGLPDRYDASAASVMNPVERIGQADRFIRNTSAHIRHGGDRGVFSPATAQIQMPFVEVFGDAAVQVATLSPERALDGANASSAVISLATIRIAANVSANS